MIDDIEIWFSSLDEYVKESLEGVNETLKIVDSKKYKDRILQLRQGDIKQKLNGLKNDFEGNLVAIKNIEELFEKLTNYEEKVKELEEDALKLKRGRK